MAACTRSSILFSLPALVGALLLPSAARCQCVGQWLYPQNPPTVDDSGGGTQVDASALWSPGGVGTPQVLAVGGAFTSAGSVTANNIAYWDGANWNALGAGFDDGQVNAVAVLPNGTLVAAGNFTTSNSNAVNHIASWNAAAGVWQPLGSGLDNQVFALAVMPNGNLIAGGTFVNAVNGTQGLNNIASWNGTTWSGLGTGIQTSSSYVTALAVLPDGTLAVGGARFTKVGNSPTSTVSANRIAIWNPSTSTWSALGTGITSATSSLGVNSLLVAPGGNLIVGGAITSAGGVAGTSHIAGWNGTAWFALGKGLKGPGVTASASGSALALAVMPNGDIIAGGSFTSAGNVTAGDTPAAYVARWNGSAWAPLNSDEPDSNVLSLTVTPAGVLNVGGAFTFLGNNLQPFLSEYADCVGSCCQSDGSCIAAAGSPTATCTTGTLLVNGTCSPNTCTVASGVCCQGATCNLSTPEAACTGSGHAGASFSTAGSSCNAAGTSTTPCCYADYNKTGGITVQDIFDFLADWFAKSPYATVGGDGTTTPTVQSIFNFLAAWFARGC